MPRVYKREPGARTYCNFSIQKLEEALHKIRTKQITQRQAEQQYRIPRSTLKRKLKGVQNLRHGGQTAIDEVTEHLMAEYVKTCSKFGFPFNEFDVRCLVKAHLDRQGITVEKFKNNLPGRDWVRGFIKRHRDLTERMASNIKKSRAKVSPDTINEYFDFLEKELECIPPSNIYNYDETNLTDDPGQKKIITKRGIKYPERILNSSKSSTSIMICGNAEGHLLPPYVVYKSKELWNTWTEGGPHGCRYNRTLSGWFDATCFDDWFTQVVLPNLKKLPGKKALIGDNLSSHLNPNIIELCSANNIKFICLPPNSTHLTQPLDLAFFRPMKGAWRNILLDYKQKTNKSPIPKNDFPKLLKKLMTELESTVCQSIMSGFKKSGICPLDRDEVLDRLPTKESEISVKDKEFNVSASVLDFLQSKRYGEEGKAKGSRKKKINVPPGKSVTAGDFPVASTSTSTNDQNTNKAKKATRTVDKRPKKIIVSSDSESDVHDPDDISLCSEFEDEDFDDLLEDQEEMKQNDTTDINTEVKKTDQKDNKKSLKNIVKKEKFEKDVGSHVISIYEGEYFPGIITEISGTEFRISSMVMSGQNFKWPDKPDICWFADCDIKEVINPPTLLNIRGTYDVPEMKKWRQKDNRFQ